MSSVEETPTKDVIVLGGETAAGDTVHRTTPTVFYDRGPEGKGIGRQTLTKFEVARIRGLRIEQLSRGAFGSVPLTSELQTVEQVVDAEIRGGTIPFIIMRHYPNGASRAYRLRYMDTSLFDNEPAR